MKEPYRIYLSEDEMPKQWYNLRADMPEQPEPFLNPGTLKPLTEEELAPIFCKELCRQEMTTERYIDIPQEVLDFYRIYRAKPCDPRL